MQLRCSSQSPHYHRTPGSAILRASPCPSSCTRGFAHVPQLAPAALPMTRAAHRGVAPRASDRGECGREG
eukprot:scaffold14954_cov122-Isochrysis_galbana.AAC.2